MFTLEEYIKKKVYQWKNVEEGEYGRTLQEIKAEFQSVGLVSKGSSPIVCEKVKIGAWLKYICSEEDCSFAARVKVLIGSELIPEVQTTSIL